MTPIDLKTARKRLGMTQAQLAHALRMRSGARTIRRMEAGEVEVSGPVQVAVEMMLERAGGDEAAGEGVVPPLSHRLANPRNP